MNEVDYPIDGTLDLHTFHPGDIKDLIPEYIEVCRQKNILNIRIVHGKGKGVLRRMVHSILDKHPHVVHYQHEGGSGGSWGATVVQLKPL
jgi:DNA-nicking Smr family endonuclease